MVNSRHIRPRVADYNMRATRVLRMVMGDAVISSLDMAAGSLEDFAVDHNPGVLREVVPCYFGHRDVVGIIGRGRRLSLDHGAGAGLLIVEADGAGNRVDRLG